uniref:Uncharacterized protein n=1 Tax=Siphoviridae sp. cttuu15 TaxID=2825709 RepID=A0A8S5U1D3_9CAUD|nr:MAG TPA: hypothetical protein [Siphoviridae sp. cttuu15]
MITVKYTVSGKELSCLKKLCNTQKNLKEES